MSNVTGFGFFFFVPIEFHEHSSNTWFCFQLVIFSCFAYPNSFARTVNGSTPYSQGGCFIKVFAKKYIKALQFSASDLDFFFLRHLILEYTVFRVMKIDLLSQGPETVLLAWQIASNNTYKYGHECYHGTTRNYKPFLCFVLNP